MTKNNCRLTMDPTLDAECLAARFFSPREAEFIRTLSPAEQIAAFHALWTGKEAVAKCAGKGIVAALDQIHISLDSAARFAAAQRGSQRWSLVPLPPIPGYAAALAVRGDPPGMRCQALSF